MKALQILLAAPLLALACHAGAGDTAKAVAANGIEPLNVFAAPVCQASGDGTYAEIVTTMASVLPPAQGDALLARYCDKCNLSKFALAQGR